MSLRLTLPTLDDVDRSPQSTCILPTADWLRPTPAFVADLSRAGDRTPLDEPFRAALAQRYRTTLQDQLVFGFDHFQAALGTDETLHAPSIEGAAQMLDRHVARDPGPQFRIPDILHDDAGYLVDYRRFDPAAARVLDGPAFLATPIEPQNWGMWLLQGLPAVADYLRLGQPGALLCYCAQPWQRALLAFMGVQADRVVNQDPWAVYRVPQVTLHQQRTIDHIPRAADIALFSAIAERVRRRMQPPRYGRLFLSRRSVSQRAGAYRVLRNEDALIEALRPHGFLIVEAELLSFEEQVALFDQAETVAGLGGAAMFNTLFCRPGTRVVSIESTPAFVHNHANIFAAAGHRYAFILGEDDPSAKRYPHNPWTIDVPRAAALVAEFAAG